MRIPPHVRATKRVQFTCTRCVSPDTDFYGQPAERIKAGDSISSATSLFTKVIKRSQHQFDGHLLEVKVAGCLPFRVTPDHPVLVIHGELSRQGVTRGRRLFSEEHFIPAKNIIPWRRHKRGDFLLLPRLKGACGSTLLSLKPFVRGKKRISRGQLELKLTPQTAWLMGLYIAEGTGGEEATFHLGKHELRLIRKAMNAIRTLGYSTSSHQTPTSTDVHLPSRLSGRAFKVWFGAGAKNKHIPKFIIAHKNSEILSSVLKGIADGDGCVTVRNRKKWLSYATVSLTLAKQIQLAHARLGQVAMIYERPEQKPSFIEGREIKGGISYVIRVPEVRAQNCRGKTNGKYILLPVNHVKKVSYTGKVFDLTTKHGTFLMSNIITHNCGHQWVPRLRPADVCLCPNCKSPLFRKLRRSEIKAKRRKKYV